MNKYENVMVNMMIKMHFSLPIKHNQAELSKLEAQTANSI